MSIHPIFRSSESRLAAALLLAIALIYSLMSLWTPPLYDDLSFISLYHDYSGGSSDFSLSALAGYFRELRLNDNSRLANVLSPFTTLITPWRYLFPWLTGLAIAFIAALGVRICGYADFRGKFIALFWALMILFLPWRDSIFVADYSLNYVYASAVTLPLLWLLGEGRASLRRGPAFAGTLLLALLAGVWHEGFAAPMLAALGLLCLARRLRMGGWRWWAVVVLYFLATCFIIFCPGILARSGREVGSRFGHLTYKVIFDLAAVILLIGSAALLTLFRAGRRMLREAWENDSFILASGVALAAGVLSIIVEHTPRTSFWPDLCALLALLILWRRPIEAIMQRRLAPWIAGILTLCCLAQSVLALTWQHKYYKEYQEVIALFENTDSETVYYDLILPQSVSKLTLNFPSRSAWFTDFQYYVLEMAYERPGAAVVPTALRHLPQHPDTISPPGAATIVMKTGTHLYTNRLPRRRYSDHGAVLLRLHDEPERVWIGAHIIDFTTEEGDSLSYVYPFFTNVSRIMAVDSISVAPRR